MLIPSQEEDHRRAMQSVKQAHRAEVDTIMASQSQGRALQSIIDEIKASTAEVRVEPLSKDL